jgi:hypothetical protein
VNQSIQVKTAGKGESKMKLIKMFGLAALAALLAMVFAGAGAGSAMAEETQLCKVDPGTGSEEVCPPGEGITSVHEVSVGKAKLLASPEVQCNVLFESTSVGQPASPQVIEGHFTYTNCGCTVKEKAGTTAKINVLKEGHETASVTGEAEIIVTCFGIECTYKGTGLKGTAKGPLLSTEANGEVNLSEQEVTGKGAFCPSKGKLDIKTTPLTATRIAVGRWLEVCLDTQREKFLYTNTTCTTHSGGVTGKYTLGYVLRNLAVVDEMACAAVGPNGGFREGNGGAAMQTCTNEILTKTTEYELGFVKTVR